MMSVAYKNRTRDEVIAASRESIRRKHEWEERTMIEFRRIREERRFEEYINSEEFKEVKEEVLRECSEGKGVTLKSAEDIQSWFDAL